MRKVSMFQLQELVRLQRLGTGCSEVARLLGISPNTERRYREARIAAGMLDGSSEQLPAETGLYDAVEEHMGTGERLPQPSSVQAWMYKIELWAKGGAQGKAIYERLKREGPSFEGSHSALHGSLGTKGDAAY